MRNEKKGIPERNKAVIERVKLSAESELAEECWEKTLDEIERGWLSEPVF